VKETYLPRASANIAQVDHDGESQTMTITFKDGRSYEYSGVPHSVFMGIQNAPSAGSYFFRQIRGRYAEQEV
jgi:hypothetical protein